MYPYAIRSCNPRSIWICCSFITLLLIICAVGQAVTVLPATAQRSQVRMSDSPPLLTLTITSASLNTYPGASITYIINYANTGSGTFTNVLLEDVLPAEVSYLPGSASGGGSYNATTSTLSWVPGSLSPGQSAQCTFQVMVNANVQVGTELNNFINITATQLAAPISSRICAVTVLSSSAQGDWWMFQHDRQHTGRSSYIGPNSPVGKWIFYIMGSHESSPIFAADGTIYAMSSEDNLYAINSDGSVKWTFADAVDGNYSPLIGTDGTIYIESWGGGLYALNPDGTKRWDLYLNNDNASINSSPAIGVDGTIYVGATDGNLYAITSEGIQRWTFLTGSCVESTPAIGVDGTIYFGSDDCNLYALNPDGTLQWTFPTSDYISSSPAIGTDGTIYIGSADYNFYAVNPDGTPQWAFPTGNSILTSPAIGVDGTIYFDSYDYKLYALNPDGTQKWIYSNEIFCLSPVLGADGTIYLASSTGYPYYKGILYALNPDGTQKWNFIVGESIGSSPIIGPDGIIYLPGWSNNLYAIGDNETYIITPSAGAGGAINPNNAQTVSYDSSLTFTAAPNSGYVVNGWAVDGTIVETGLTTFTLSNIVANHSVQVTFTPLTFSVTPAAGANGGISPNSVQTVNYGGSLTFTATPSTGYTVSNWAVDGVSMQSGGSGFTLNSITANHNVLVTFALLSFTITPSAGAHGGISPNSVQTVNYGGSLTFTASANTGYTVNAWTVDGKVAQSGGATFALSNITANHAVQVTFTPLSYTITPSAGANGSISPSNAQTVNYGGTLTFAALPQTGYAVNAWSVDGTPAQSGGTAFTLANITANHAVQVTFTPAILSAVVLSANPGSPRPMNTAVTLTATPTGNGGQVSYLFRAGYSDAAGWHWTNLTSAYTTTASCSWTPASAGSFTLVVWARIIGHTANYDQYATLNYQVTLQPITAVALSAKPVSPQPVNTAIMLTASPTGGGGQVQYLFRAGYTDAAGWHWTNLNSTYTTTATCTWTPTAVESYTLVVWARLIGHSANYDQYATQGYQVTVPPITAVALSAKPVSPQPVNTAITLTASPTGGGGQVQYLFRAGYTDAAGWHWTNLNSTYTTTATCTWTPTAVESYTLVVWARLIGHTANYDQYATQGYQVTVPPISAVALSAKPASPQPVNTAITLTASPTGGGDQVNTSSAPATPMPPVGIGRISTARIPRLPPAAGRRQPPEASRWWSGRACWGIPSITINMQRSSAIR